MDYLSLIHTALSTPLFCLPLTIGVYLLSVQIYVRLRIRLLHPLAVSICFLIYLLMVSHTEYKSYKEGSEFINFMLGPSVVSLGYVLYEQSEQLKGRVFSILTTVMIGAIAGILSAAGLAYFMGAGEAITASMEPKGATTPIAIAVSAKIGGIPSLTAVVVVISGIFGGLVGPPILKLLKIESRVATGLALGASAHGVGTAVAIQLGAVEGALGGLAIGIMGVWTAVLVPALNILFAYLK